jgi:hypothetical protein
VPRSNRVRASRRWTNYRTFQGQNACLVRRPLDRRVAYRIAESHHPTDDGSFLQGIAEQINLPASIKDGLPTLF